MVFSVSNAYTRVHAHAKRHIHTHAHSAIHCKRKYRLQDPFDFIYRSFHSSLLFSLLKYTKTQLISHFLLLVYSFGITFYFVCLHNPLMTHACSAGVCVYASHIGPPFLHLVIYLFLFLFLCLLKLFPEFCFYSELNSSESCSFHRQYK